MECRAGRWIRRSVSATRSPRRPLLFPPPTPRLVLPSPAPRPCPRALRSGRPASRRRLRFRGRLSRLQGPPSILGPAPLLAPASLLASRSRSPDRLLVCRGRLWRVAQCRVLDLRLRPCGPHRRLWPRAGPETVLPSRRRTRWCSTATRRRQVVGGGRRCVPTQWAAPSVGERVVATRAKPGGVPGDQLPARRFRPVMQTPHRPAASTPPTNRPHRCRSGPLCRSSRARRWTRPVHSPPGRRRTPPARSPPGRRLTRPARSPPGRRRTPPVQAPPGRRPAWPQLFARLPPNRRWFRIRLRRTPSSRCLLSRTRLTKLHRMPRRRLAPSDVETTTWTTPRPTASPVTAWLENPARPTANPPSFRSRTTAPRARTVRRRPLASTTGATVARTTRRLPAGRMTTSAAWADSCGRPAATRLVPTPATGTLCLPRSRMAPWWAALGPLGRNLQGRRRRVAAAPIGLVPGRSSGGPRGPSMMRAAPSSAGPVAPPPETSGPAVGATRVLEEARRRSGAA